MALQYCGRTTQKFGHRRELHLRKVIKVSAGEMFMDSLTHTQETYIRTVQNIYKITAGTN